MGLGSIAAENKLIKCGRKLKKILSTTSLLKSCNKPVSVSSCHRRRAVRCDELFLKGHYKGRNDCHDDQTLAAYFAAQNYFTLRPNMYV
ncbi:hypothetical protein JCGZ_13767 [Jatropha curcas]|uniref:Uncharacterized protein n=1 Tax=Jatropha curcas TaxID=180498 RepID=A0A067KG59_JATCU|nr:hypothetical protein JCGZ_13767 [Jatropha curcas]